MTKAQYLQMVAHYTRSTNQAEKRIEEAKEAYIKTNAPYPVGAKLQIDDSGIERHVMIQKYIIDENDNLQPVFVGLNGKCQFTHKPTIIKELNQ